MNSNLENKEYLYLLTYPIYSLGRLVYNLPPIRFIRNIFKNTTRKHVIEKSIKNKHPVCERRK